MKDFWCLPVPNANLHRRLVYPSLLTEKVHRAAAKQQQPPTRMNFPPPFPNEYVGLNPTSANNPNFYPRFALPPPQPVESFQPQHQPQPLGQPQPQLQPQPQPQLQPPPQPQPRPQPQPQPQPQPPISDLPTALSHLNNLLDLSLSTVHSLRSLLPAVSLQRSPFNSPDGFSRCPFNPQHIMPPESLFLHTLHCPHPLEGTMSHLNLLHSPKTFEPKHELTREKCFVQPPNDPQAEVCFSLEDYVDLGSNFFYQDCPGVVSLLSLDSSKRIFSLPSILLTECANLASIQDQRISWDETSSLKQFLPSDFWFVKIETEKWHDFPRAYSYSVFTILSCLPRAKECDLPKWIIANSPRFGVVIDLAMRDHIFALLRVCVKAIVREANRSYDLLLKTNLTDENGGPFNPKTWNVECPVLVQTLTWMVSQLSILYTEANAKCFAISMLSHMLVSTASDLLVYPLSRDVYGTSSSEMASGTLDAAVSDKLSGELVNDDEHSNLFQQRTLGNIFVYQIAAAIAAMYERSSLEDKLQALRNSRPPPAHHRMTEHAYLSKLAEEERQKRPNYKPLIEHEGLPLQHPHAQGIGNQFKTKEELLAEERDYKRRRMSYRGKKLKRAPKEVMRDIIEEHMHAIKRVGGIGCFGSVNASNTSSDFENSERVYSNRSTPKENESNKDQHQNYGTYLHSHSRSPKPINANHQKTDQWVSNYLKPEEKTEHRIKESRTRHKSHSYSRSPSIDRSYGRSDDQRSDRWKYRAEVGQDKHYRSNYAAKHSHRSPAPTSSYAGVSYRRKDKQNIEDSEKHMHTRYRSDRSSHTSRSGFRDRYDPCRSPDPIEDEYSDGKYHRREKR